MAVPRVAIVGRPNVGKSSVFNWLAGRRIAIVDPTAGVTRDRLTTLVQTGDRYFELIDTGGMGGQDVDNLAQQIEQQIETAIDDAHCILFVVDAREGLMPLDHEVARRLRGINKPVVLVANKSDMPSMDSAAQEFYKLGFDQPICVSTKQNRNKDQLLQAILERLPEDADRVQPADDVLKLAIVGRRNTGKSTFINALAREERMIVSEMPGTTRDSVDVRFERDGRTFVAIDTAGVRKKSKVAESLEFYGLHRAERSIRRADVVLMFFDAQLRISKVDKQLAGYILDNHKPAIFVVNKWDLAGGVRTGKFGDYIRANFPSLDYVPLAFISAKKGENVHGVLKLAQDLHRQAAARVSTSELNRVLRHAIALQEPPLRQNRRPRIFYATQAATNPPTIVLFTNGPELFDNTYVRYLLKTFRDQLPFSEVPIKLYLRQRHREEAPAEAKIEEGVPRHKTRPKRKRAEPEVWKDV